VPLLDHKSEEVAYAFLDKVLSRFSALAKVFTNQGTEFQKDFQDLCEKAMIDHQSTSQDHFEANKLAKQMV
jgi:hypothetical protein